MVTKTTYPMPRERNLILVLLLILAALSWALLVWQSAMSDKQTMGIMAGMDAPLFIAIWVVMMVAVMFPTAAPMILMFARIYASKREQGQPFVPTWIFVSSYLIVWTLFGVLAYAAALGAEELGKQSMWLMDNAARFGGGVIVLAGLYQLSPLKNSCLSKCRTPMNFILNSWREGYRGSFRMGLDHGFYCLGCCWLLFIILFPLGVMNVAAMAVITLLIFAEKSLSLGQKTAKIAAVVLIVYGTLIIFVPGMLPTMN
jgi:predicted metal-binding membrane protein